MRTAYQHYQQCSNSVPRCFSIHSDCWLVMLLSNCGLYVLDDVQFLDLEAKNKGVATERRIRSLRHPKYAVSDW